MATKKQIFLPFLVIVIAVAAMFGLMALKEPPQEKPIEKIIPVVQTTTLTLSNLNLIVESQGLVQAKDQTQLVAQVSGQIINVSPEFIQGGQVKAGDILAQIDPSDYEANLVEAQANLASARASLLQEKAKGRVAEKEWQKITNAKPSELGLRKPQLAKEVAKVRAAEAVVKKAQRNLDRTIIKAPYDAVVEQRNISLGSVVGSGTMLGQILAINTAYIRLPIADQDFAYLTNQGIGATVEIIGQYHGQPHSWFGNIIRNEGVIDKKSRMNYLVAEITTPYTLDKPLYFGRYVSAKITGHQIENAALIPSHLVINNTIAILTQDNTLHYQLVQVIRQQGEMMVIGDIKQNTRYISSALDYPIEGMTLTLTENIINLEQTDTSNEVAQ